jgi:hypothetical protein
LVVLVDDGHGAGGERLPGGGVEGGGGGLEGEEGGLEVGVVEGAGAVACEQRGLLGLEVGEGERGERDGAVEVDGDQRAAIGEDEVQLWGALLASVAQDLLEVVGVGAGGVDEGERGDGGGLDVGALAEVVEEEVEGGLAVGLAPDVVAQEVGEAVAQGGVGGVGGGAWGGDVALVGEQPVAEAEGGGVLGADVAARAAADEADDGAGAEVAGEVGEADAVGDDLGALAD